MEIVSDEAQLNYYMSHAVEASSVADAPILVDKFLDARHGGGCRLRRDYPTEPGRVGPDSRELSSQASSIGSWSTSRKAGIHSGDSACSLPPYSLSKEVVLELKRQTANSPRPLRARP